MADWLEQDLLNHYRYSPYRGQLANPTWTSEVHNPSCGDSVFFQGIMVDGHLEEIMFEGKGCVISQAAASLLAGHVKGKALDAILALTPDDMFSLLKVSLGPTRSRCALLALEALHEGLQKNKKS